MSRVVPIKFQGVSHSRGAQEKHGSCNKTLLHLLCWGFAKLCSIACVVLVLVLGEPLWWSFWMACLRIIELQNHYWLEKSFKFS